jgi:hypothetical protein
LRLALAQGWILTVEDSEDDHLAEDLAGLSPESDRFEEMLGYLIARWRKVYADLKSGSGVLNQVNLVGVDMELVVLTSPDCIGTFDAGTQNPGSLVCDATD